MASLIGADNDKKKMLDAHEKLTFLLTEANSPVELENILDRYYSEGSVTIHFVKALQLHIDLCVKRQDFAKAQKLMAIYEIIEKRAAKKRNNTKDTQIQKAKKQLALLFDVGDATKMAQKLKTLLSTGEIELEIFKQLLRINIEIAEERGWHTKIDVLKLVTRIVHEFEKVKRQGTDSVHTPTFTFNAANAEKGEKINHGELNVIDGESADLILDVSGLAVLLSGKSGSGQKRRGNKKKKKGASGSKAQEKINKISAQLNEHGWAICDGFIDVPTCKSVRTEIEKLQPHFEASEIFVGKESEIGAHISVPSVRGDKVLWMCGGHQNENSRQFDSAGIQPKTRGNVEPCQPKIKTALPMSRFESLKTLMKSIDQLVFEKLKKKVKTLNGVSERSDCMLAKYADGGRFQRHIDNTTKDGRKLTLLCYLNPDKWDESDGGSLRLHPKNSDPVDIFPEGGRLAMFFSDLIEHEVRPTYGARFALTMWYYDKSERMEAVKKAEKLAEEKGVGDTDMALNVDAQEAAQQFIATMFNDTSLPIEDLLGAVKEKIKTLNNVSKEIVAGVVGLETERLDSVVETMTADSLYSLRESFQRMGI